MEAVAEGEALRGLKGLVEKYMKKTEGVRLVLQHKNRCGEDR